ncbi:hypothetical protein [Microbacterium rhizomatis]|uniref:hypothetical protein n=1 Tax=Microbacterium rhizomatis TaxID=1631477 RepID=UPI001478573F|nr:hypothetical protein [Microbacterium rhizomatis]
MEREIIRVAVMLIGLYPVVVAVLGLSRAAARVRAFEATYGRDAGKQQPVT